MRGLLEYDMRLLYTRGRRMPLVLVMALLVGISFAYFIGLPSTMFTCLIAMLIPFILGSWERQFHTVPYQMCMATDSSSYVREKFLFTGIHLLALWLLGLIGYIIAGLLFPSKELFEGGILRMLGTNLWILLLALIPCSILLVLKMKLGYMAFSLITFASVYAIFGSFFWVYAELGRIRFDEQMAAANREIVRILGFSEPSTPLRVRYPGVLQVIVDIQEAPMLSKLGYTLLIAVPIVVIMYQLSVVIFRKKDF
ncbi:MAG: ABC-2 transporter permease [Lachnospiraceae bacterium]|nr:ABC-2 transporter permease [Lachnospiraceae bacterium]